MFKVFIVVSRTLLMFLNLITSTLSTKKKNTETRNRKNGWAWFGPRHSFTRNIFPLHQMLCEDPLGQSIIMLFQTKSPSSAMKGEEVVSLGGNIGTHPPILKRIVLM